MGGISFPPVPLAQMATVLRHAGIPAYVVDAPAERLRTSEVVDRLTADDLLFCMSSPLSVEIDLPFLREAKARAGARTVLFGAYPSFQPEKALGHGEVDFIIRGEPELAALELAQAIRGAGLPAEDPIPGVGFKDRRGPVHPAGEARRPDLDSLPIADRTLLPDNRKYFNPVVRNARFTTAFTSRGCFGKCTFCSSPRFFRGKVRYRSPDSVLVELLAIQDAGYREVFFRDELFTGDGKRLAVICEGMRKQGLRLAWVCSTRVDLVDAEMAKGMKSAGCHLVRMGVESGSQSVLNRIRKGITVEETRAAFHACRKAGIDTHAHTMVGLPGETREDFLRTVDLIREIRPTYLTMSICTPFPGTELFREIERGGAAAPKSYLAPNRRAGLHSVPLLNHWISDIPAPELESYLKEAYREFYFHRDYIRRQLLSAASPARLLRKARAGMMILSMVSRHG
ncbi:MAG: radical SAM protein [Deltaproteobacteria bacterium]|nr:radical SAM protein [Deltaproteobacteria bacterium]